MSGPRRFNLLTDFPGVSELLQPVFGTELRQAGLTALEDPRSARLAAPILWLITRLSPRLGAHLTGYVWEEDGRLVGNVTVAPPEARGGRWVIGNLAVHPDYRRRGIARQLTRMAIDHCLAQGAETVALEVRRDNRSAYALYLSLGFCQVSSTAKLRLDGIPAVNCTPEHGALPRPLRVGDFHRARRLMEQAAPPAVGGVKASPSGARQPGYLAWVLGSLDVYLSRGPNGRWGIDQAGSLAAFLELLALGRSSEYLLTMVIHQEARGRVEQALVRFALSRLSATPRGSVLAEVPGGEPTQVSALQRSGFRIVEVMDTLALAGGLDLRSR